MALTWQYRNGEPNPISVVVRPVLKQASLDADIAYLAGPGLM